MFGRGTPAAPSLFTMQSMACRARALWDAPTVACLIDAGVDRNTIDNNTVTLLHLAVRTSCAAAVSGRHWRRRAKQEQERSTPMRSRSNTSVVGVRLARGEGAPKGDRLPRARCDH